VILEKDTNAKSTSLLNLMYFKIYYPIPYIASQHNWYDLFLFASFGVWCLQQDWYVTIITQVTTYYDAASTDNGNWVQYVLVIPHYEFYNIKGGSYDSIYNNASYSPVHL